MDYKAERLTHALVHNENKVGIKWETGEYGQEIYSEIVEEAARKMESRASESSPGSKYIAGAAGAAGAGLASTVNPILAGALGVASFGMVASGYLQERRIPENLIKYIEESTEVEDGIIYLDR